LLHNFIDQLVYFAGCSCDLIFKFFIEFLSLFFLLFNKTSLAITC